MPKRDIDHKSRLERLFHAVRAYRTGQRSFPQNHDGSTAIEFGVVALPFLALIFGILELALVFFVGSVMTQAISDAGRTIRVGGFQACGGADEFKELVCKNMKNLMDCNANLLIDVETASSFQGITLTDPGNGGLDEDDDGDGVNNSQVRNGNYTNTVAGDPVVVRGTFYYPLILPSALTRLETVGGTGRHIITASTAFRNEPFPAGGSCAVTFDTDEG